MTEYIDCLINHFKLLSQSLKKLDVTTRQHTLKVQGMWIICSPKEDKYP